MIDSGALSWCSKRQPTAVNSTTEAEYRAVSAVVKETFRLNKIVTDLGFSHINFVKICNQAHFRV